jgi:hypothetical protein
VNFRMDANTPSKNAVGDCHFSVSSNKIECFLNIYCHIKLQNPTLKNTVFPPQNSHYRHEDSFDDVQLEGTKMHLVVTNNMLFVQSFANISLFL